MRKIELWYDDVEDEATNVNIITIGENDDPVESALKYFKKFIEKNPSFKAAGAMLSDLEVIEEKVDEKRIKTYYLNWQDGNLKISIVDANGKWTER